MNIKYTSVFFIILLGFFSCHKNNEKKQITQTLTKMYNKKILFNQNLQAKFMGADTISFEIEEVRPKIIIYINRGGCTPCKLKLSEWKDYMANVHSINKKISFIFIVAPENITELDKEFIINDFKHIVYYDLNTNFEEINNLPKDSKYHTFMVNNMNKIILVGNPVINSKINELYLHKIKEL
jgi:hypothetical protein